jgi:hypothetical protein
MKRYYIAPSQVWLAHVEHFAGTSCVELDDDHLLICTDFASDWAEDQWHSESAVARLAHPKYESEMALGEIISPDPSVPTTPPPPAHPYGYKQFYQHHFDKLNILASASQLPSVDTTHTLWDLHDLLVGTYPGIRLNRY